MTVRLDDKAIVTDKDQPVGMLPGGSRPRRRLSTFHALVGLVVIATAILVVYPLVRLLYAAFFDQSLSDTSGFTQAFTDGDLGPALLNSLILLVAAGLISLVLGTALAWVNERTDAGLGWAANILPILPLLVPPVASAIGWVFLLSSHAGYVNVILRVIGGGFTGASAGSAIAADGPIDIYTVGGIVFVTAIYATPFVYLVMSSAFRNLDPALEEASRMCGVGSARTLLKVTLPAVRTSLVSAAVLTVINIVALFSIPIVIGIQKGIDVLPVLIFRVLYAASPPRLGEAVVLSAFMFIAIQAFVLVEYAANRRGRQSVVGGRGARGAKNRLGAWKWPTRTIIVLYLALTTLLPLLALIIVSLQGFWSPGINWALLSFNNYVALLDAQNDLGHALTNSLYLGVITATTLVVISALITVFIRTSRGSTARIVNAVMTLPATIPHTAIAIGFLLGFATGNVSLAGTTLVLYLAYTVLFLPAAMRAASAARSQIGDDLWESSLMSGASPLRSFRSILLPLMFSGLLAGWVIVFVQTLSEMSASVFLSGSANPVVGRVILTVWQLGGTYPQLAALATVVTVIQIIVVSVVFGLTGRRRGGAGMV